MPSKLHEVKMLINEFLFNTKIRNRYFTGIINYPVQQPFNVLYLMFLYKTHHCKVAGIQTGDFLLITFIQSSMGVLVLSFQRG